MSRDWSLRLARPGDDAVIAQLDAGRSAESAARLIRKGHCLTAHVRDAPAGFLVSEPFSRELHVWQIFVTPAYRQGGIGSGLARACVIDGRNAGFRAVTLTTDRDSTAFFMRLGFEEVTALRLVQLQVLLRRIVLKANGTKVIVAHFRSEHRRVE